MTRATPTPSRIGPPRRRRVFLSYRREDCAVHAGRLADNLTDRVGADVFFDVDTVRLGENFVKAIEREVTRCDMVIVMIGDDWLDIAGRDGRPRIQDPRDFVHLEVYMALKRDIPVIPVLVEGATMPRADQLPHELRDLAFRNAAELREGSWKQDFERLAGALPAPSLVEATPAPGGAAVKARRTERASIDFVAARAFVESIPAGRWSTYQQVARAAGSPRGAMAIGNWLRTQGEDVPHVWRVLNRRGEVSEGWAPADPSLPATPESVRERLASEGVRFDARSRAAKADLWMAEESAESGAPSALGEDEQVGGSDRRTADTLIVAGRLAYPDYLLSGAYICQAGRSFRPGIEHLGFYAEREIKREIPRILHRRDNVVVTAEHASELRGRGAPFDLEVARRIDQALDPGTDWRIRREPGQPYQFFLLSHPSGDETLVLPQVIWHGGRGAWTQSQRYTTLEVLRAGPSTTELL